MANIKPYKEMSLANLDSGTVISHLTDSELVLLTEAFKRYYDTSEGKKRNKRASHYGKYWIIFLFLRATGARLSEVLAIDEARDIDFRNSEARLITLKRHNKKKKGILTRLVPIDPNVINEYLRFINLHPEVKGKVFKIKRNNFFIVFRRIALSVNIPKDLAHPHILRHTRAIELLRAGIPVTAVQQLLGHAMLNTTAMYLKYSAIEVKSIMKDRGLI